MKLFGQQQVRSKVMGPLLLVIICFACVNHIDAQFFTKSSKSIPRMGRRSIEPAYPADRYRRLLIDTLIDEYGPNLLQVLEILRSLPLTKTQARVATNNRALPIGELAYRNDQALYPKRANEDETTEMRDERSTSGRDSSLAMRALNTNRYLQYLTSGQPIVSYARLFGGPEADSANGRDTATRENTNKYITNDR